MLAKGFKQPSSMTHSFREVPHADIQRSSFKRSRGYKTTFDSGYLIPFFMDEALPGDTFRVNLTSVARLATPLVPIMDNIHLDFFFFAVPNRLIWDNWQKFCGERADPGDSIDYTVPTVDAPAGTGFVVGTLADYFGLPTGVTGLTVNSLHFRAYNLVYREWFRDQNLIDSPVVDTGDGPDTLTDYVLRKRCKRHDYFTSCLPWPQKGEGVDLPLGTTAPVIGDGNVPQVTNGSTLFELAGATTIFPGSTTGNAIGDGAVNGNLGTKYLGWTTDPDHSGLIVDLTDATAATINSLREAFQLQKMLERDARGGTRYTEILKSHFRVESPDARLQRPEYLGGGSSNITVAPIPQTSEDSGGTPQGHLAAIGYGQHSGIGFTKSFVEHCTLIGVMCAWVDLTYQTGVDRMWSRQTRYDYYWPALAHLGEQEVLNGEIYAQGTSADDDVFGYQERWAEYRYGISKITGKLRSSYATSLDKWHLSQDFSALPVLNQSFIEEDPPIDRIIAVPTEPEFLFDGFMDVLCTRPMPVYSVPGLIDHF